MFIIKELIICLIITIVIEYIPIVIFLQIPKKYFIAVNVLTNVVANIIVLIYDLLGIKNLGIISRSQVFIVLETIVCAVEIFLYYEYIKMKKLHRINNSQIIENKESSFINAIEVVKIVVLTIFANVTSFIIGTKILLINFI